MSETYYQIEMQTPIGIKRGTMRVQTAQNEISGLLELLNHSEPFYGSIDMEGYCKFAGHIVTLMRKIEYVAFGKISSESICLSLQEERGTYQITGVVYSQKSS